MKKLVNFVVLIGLLGLTTSCLDEMDVPMSDTEANTVSFIIEDFTPEAQTKSAFQTPTMKFRWSEDDIIGIFPEDGWQTQFNMESGAGGNTAVFDGGSWGLKDDATYYAYYPFSKENFEFMGKREYVSFSYEGQKAAFADGDGVVDVSGYDFMASGASTVDNGAVSFRFSHLGALCRIRFAAPAAAEYSYVSIEANSEMFNMTGYYDATDKDGDGVISYVSETSAASLSFSIPSGKGAFEAGENVEFYFLMAPTDLRGQILTFRLVDNGNNEYEAEVGGKEILAGSSYAWDVVWPGGEGETPGDGTPATDATANCYIVSESGSYSFPTVMGNSSVSVGDVVSAEVLWESFGTDVAPEVGDLVTEVSYSKGMISYTVPSPFKEGNAVIAAKDEAGTILWSWHIWLTDQPADQVYRNNAGTMMDRNLGATSATPGDVGALGLFYQWGRKDPFLGSSSISTNTTAKSTLVSWPSGKASSESVGTIAYAIANPTTFIKYNTNNSDWYYSVDSSTDNTRWQSVKTVYDPCPVGYRVPDGWLNGAWYKAFGCQYSYFYDETVYDSTNKGFNFTEGSMTDYYLTDEEACWYPSAGWLFYFDGLPINTGLRGGYWSCSPSDYGADALHFSSDGYVELWNNFYARAYGLPVRCLKEE